MKPGKRVARGRKVGRKGLSLRASAEKVSAQEPRRRYHSMEDLDGLYRPVKKPVTLRLDADVIAWFKKDGRRYQTRINAALRKVMEQEMKSE